MISIPDTLTLVPVREGDNLYLFPFSGTELVKLDLPTSSINSVPLPLQS